MRLKPGEKGPKGSSNSCGREPNETPSASPKELNCLLHVWMTLHRNIIGNPLQWELPTNWAFTAAKWWSTHEPTTGQADSMHCLAEAEDACIFWPMLLVLQLCELHEEKANKLVYYLRNASFLTIFTKFFPFKQGY